MALTYENSNGGINAVLPVQPMGNGGNYGGYAVPYAMPYAMPMAYGYGNGGNNDFLGGDGSWLILFLILAMGGMWGGGFGGFGGGMWGMDGAFPWLITGQQGINANTNAGFNQMAVTTGIGDLSNAVTAGFGDVQLGIAGVNQNICQTGAGITSAVNQGVAGIQNSLCNGFANTNQTIQNGFSQAEIADNARQMANMQQAFANQTAMNQGFNGVSSQLAQCCCDNRLGTADLKYTIATENCADRAAISDGIRDVLTANTANSQAVLNTINQGIQSIKDQLCQDKIDEKNDTIAQLRQEVLYARGQASQDVQTAVLQSGQRALANEVEQYVAPRPIPAYTVQNPNCCMNMYSCGCGN